MGQTDDPGRRRGRPSGSALFVSMCHQIVLVRDSFAFGKDVHHSTAATGAELNVATDKCEQGVVATATDARARMEVSATLPNYDLARIDQFATEALHAEALRI